MNSKLLFLDIDGVLNSTHDIQRGVQLDPSKVLLVEGACLATGARIVISSNWRFLHDVEELKWLLKVAGLRRSRVVGVTPGSTESRGREVLSYLQEVWGRGSWSDYRYVILDDDSDFLPEQIPRLVRTNKKYGLTVSDANRAIELLT